MNKLKLIIPHFKIMKTFEYFVHTLVNTADAVDQDKQGTKTIGLGQFVAAKEAICNN